MILLPSYGQIEVITIKDCICSGEYGQQIFEVTAEGTAGPFIFNWSGPNGYSSVVKTPVSITEPGTYTVTITNTYGCEVTFDNLTIPACPAITLSEGTVTPACGNNGVIDILASGGQGSLSFLWSNGASTQNLDGLASGVYAVTATDEQGCEAELEVFLPGLNGPAFTEVITAACGDQPTGSIELLFNDIGSIQSIGWSTGSTGPLLPAQVAGDYGVTVTDVSGCQTEAILTIPSEPLPGIVSSTVVPATCTDGNDGSITLELTAANYDILWSDGITGTASRINLAAGEYCVTLTDPDSGCSAEGCFEVSPQEPQVTYPYLEKVTVFAGGEIIYLGEWLETAEGCLFFTGGMQDISPALVTAMSNGALGWGVRAEFSEAIAQGGVVVFQPSGVYQVLNSTPDDQIWEFTVDESFVQNLLADNNVSETFVFSAESLDGEPIFPMGNVSNNLQACVDIPEISIQTCDWVPVLPPVLNEDNTHVIQIQCIDLSLVYNETTNTLCLAYPDGTQFSTIIWNTPGGPEFDVECLDMDNAASGEYCVKVETSDGCIAKACLDFCKVLPVEIGSIDPCASQTNGSICLAGQDGMPFQVVWQDGSTEACLTNIGSGEYCAEITAIGCDATIGGSSQLLCVTLESPLPLTYSYTLNEPCPGENTGNICLSPSGGRPPYTVVWASGETGNCLAGLGTGCWSFTLSDQCGSQISECIPIDALSPEQPTLAAVNTHASCDGTGTINLQLSGGHAPFTYQLIGNSSNFTSNLPTFEGIPWGIYSISITDACGFNYSLAEVELTEPAPDPPSLVDGTTEASCGGSATGSINLNFVGGHEPLNYTLFQQSTGVTFQNSNPNFSELAAGSYTLYASDECGNSYDLGVFAVAAENIFELDFTIDAICDEESTGSIYADITFVGGSPLFTYLWSTGDQTQDLLNVGPGAYTLTVTEENSGCSLAGTVDLSIHEILLTNATIIGETIDNGIGQGNGTIFPNFSGNLGGATFLWNNGTTQQQLLNVSAGTYSLTITDASECEWLFEFVVPGCDFSIPLDIYLVSIIPSTNGNNGELQINPTSTSDIASVNWSGPNGYIAEGTSINGLAPGTYTVVVEDDCGRQRSEEYTIIDSCDHLNPDVGYTDLCMGQLFTNSRIDFSGLIANTPLSLYGDEVTFYYEIKRSFNDDIIVASLITAQWQDLSVGEGPGPLGNGYVVTGDLAHTVIDNDEPGAYEVYIRDPFGCEWSDVVVFGLQENIGGLYYRNVAANPPGNGLIDQATDTPFDLWISTGSFTCDGCDVSVEDGFPLFYDCLENNDFNIYPFQYEPTSPTEPCTQGGTITVFVPNGMGGVVENDVTVFPSDFATTFQSGGTCGCLFPVGTIFDGFLNTESVIGPGLLPETLPVYVEFPCGSDDPPTGGCYFDDSECLNCAPMPSVDNPCTYDLVCLDNGEILVSDLIGTGDYDNFCIRLNGDIFDVVTPCSSNPCDNELAGFENSFLTLDEITAIYGDIPFCACLDTDGLWTGEDSILQMRRIEELEEQYLEIKETEPDFNSILYPNPGSDRVTLVLEELEIATIHSLKIQDVRGREVWNAPDHGNFEPSILINTSSWPNGVYRVIIQLESGEIITKQWVKLAY